MRAIVTLLCLSALSAIPCLAQESPEQPTRDRPAQAVRETPADDQAEFGNVVDARADELLRKMGEFLGRQKQFTYTSENTVDQADPDGHKLQFTRRIELTLQRPDKIHAVAVGDDWNKEYWFDGATVTLLDRGTNVYSSVEAPKTIDEMFDFLYEKYGMTVPVADLLFSKPYETLSQGLESGRYVGLHAAGGVKCHHLAFRQPSVDWQIWVEDGEKPLPRKLVITYKQTPGSPQFTAVFNDWKLDPTIAGSAFKFVPPENSQKVELLPVNRYEAPAADEIEFEENQ